MFKDRQNLFEGGEGRARGSPRLKQEEKVLLVQGAATAATLRPVSNVCMFAVRQQLTTQNTSESSLSIKRENSRERERHCD